MPDGHWYDLRIRTIWGLALAAMGLAGVIAGGIWFQMLAVFVTAVMIWELARMIEWASPEAAMLLAAFTASLLSGLLATQGGLHLALLALPAVIGAVFARAERVTFFIFALAIVTAGWGLVSFRSLYGPLWLFWLILVVVATDIAGYFGGRLVGGPKLWPRISPAKTWAGLVTGWGAAGLVGGGFWAITEAGRDILWISVLLGIAAQTGDLAESALKRRMGVRNSSTLIPGHGGLFDRFDGLLGAALVMLATALVVDVPQLRP